MVSKQFEPEGGLIVGDVAGEENRDKPEVRSVFGVEFGPGALVGDVGRAWPETVAVSGPAVAVGEDGAGAVAKLLRFY